MCYVSIDTKFALFGVMRLRLWVIGHRITLTQNWVIRLNFIDVKKEKTKLFGR